MDWYIHTSTLLLNLQGRYIKLEANFQSIYVVELMRWYPGEINSGLFQSILNNIANVQIRCRVACDYRYNNSLLWKW